MDPRQVTRLVEWSELNAYSSLVHSAPKQFLASHGIGTVSFGSAMAIFAESITTSLNLNRVLGLGIGESVSESTLDAILAFFRERGVSFGIEIGPHAEPRALLGWMRQRRIRRGIATAMLYRPTEIVDPGQERVLVVRAKSSERDLVGEICRSVFGMPHAAGALIAATADSVEWRHWLAYSGDSPAAAALSYVRDGVAWLGWDATLAEFRGSGAQRSLIAHRMNDATRAGCNYVTAETAVVGAAGTGTSYRNYERLGFRLAYERFTYVGVRPAHPPPDARP